MVPDHILRSASAYTSSSIATPLEGLLPNGNFEQPPKSTDVKKTVLLHKNALPKREASGLVDLRNILDVDFLWKETRLRQLMSSPGAQSARPSTPPSYSSGPSTPPSYSSGSSTPPNYSSGSSRNAECSNCKHLHGKISVPKATMNMHMHPEQHTVNSAALLHEVLNEMKKLDLE
nr:hypothetical protein [Tanacetum cinerariifolium]